MRPVNSVYNGTDWVILTLGFNNMKTPVDIKALYSLSEFTYAIKLWKSLRCHCRNYKTRTPQVDFVKWMYLLCFCFYYLLWGVQEVYVVFWWRDNKWASSLQRFFSNSLKELRKLSVWEGSSRQGFMWSFCISRNDCLTFHYHFIWYRIVDLE